MAVSPADFELYSRATGTPLPRTPQEQMRLAPQVHSFIQNRGYQRGPVQRTAGALDNVLGGIRNTALIGAGLLGAGLAASAYANKRDSDSSGAVEPPKTPVGPEYTRRRPIPTRSRPVEAPVQADSSSDPWEGSYSDGAITTVPPKMSNTGTVVTDLNKQPVEDTSNYTSGDAIRGIGSMWGTDGRQGGQRFAPGGRTRVEEDQYTGKPNFSSIKTAPTLFNPLGKTTIANPEVIGTDREGNPITSTPKAAFTDKPLQFPFVNRTNPGLAFIAASTEAPTTGLPLVDEISVPVISNLTGWHLPGLGQAVTTAGPYIAGLARQGAGDAVDTMRFAGSGLNYVAKNLRPILQQGKEDFSKGVRDIRTGAQDVGLVGRTMDQLKLAAAMKRDEDLGLIQKGAQGVATWAQKLRENEGRPLEGTNTVEIGGEHDLGDNPQFDDPGQQHEQISVAPSRVEPIRDRVDKLLETASEYLGATDHFQGAVGPKKATGAKWVRSGDGKLKKQEDPGSSFLRGVRVSPEGEITVSEEATLSNWRNRKEAASAAGVDKVVDEYHYPQYAHDDYDDPLVQQAKAHLLEEKMNQLSALDQGKPWGDFEGKTKTTPQSKSGGQWYNQELKGPFGGDKPGRYERSGMTDATYVQSRIPDSEVFSGESDSQPDTATRMSSAYDRLNEKEDTPSRQMSYTFPLQGNMTDEEYFNQGAFKIAKTAVDNPDFDSEAYYDNKKKWVQDQMD